MSEYLLYQFYINLVYIDTLPNTEAYMTKLKVKKYRELEIRRLYLNNTKVKLKYDPMALVHLGIHPCDMPS